MATDIVLVLLLSLISVIGFCAFLVLVKDARGSLGSGGGVIFLLFMAMAYFLWKSLPGQSEPVPTPSIVENISNTETVAAGNSPSAVSQNKEHSALNKDNEYKMSHVSIIKFVYEHGLVKILYITFMAFLPIVFYLLFIYFSDQVKPEPVPALLLAVFIGVSLTVVGKFLGFSLYACELSSINDLLKSLNIGFIRIAIPTEVAKWLCLFAFLAFNKYYDEYYDGIVYSVCLSMGLACILCVGYMIQLMGYFNYVFYVQGLVTFLVIIPLNVIAGSIMGYYIALSRRRNRFLNYALSLVLPVLASGVLYSIVAYLDDVLWQYLIFVLILTPLSVVVYRQMWHLMMLDEKQSQDI